MIFNSIPHSGGTASGENLQDYRLNLALNCRDCEDPIQDSRSRQQPAREVEGLLYHARFRRLGAWPFSQPL